MLYMIKRIDNDSYFNKNIGFQNHWSYKEDARIYYTKRTARETIKRYNLKKVEVVEI